MRARPDSPLLIPSRAAIPPCLATLARRIASHRAHRRYVVEIDGSLQKMLLRAANLERDKRERWAPEMHTAANLAHIAAEQERYAQEQMKNANPFAQMFGEDGAKMLMKQQEERAAAAADD